MNAVAPRAVRSREERFPVEEVPPGEDQAIKEMIKILEQQLRDRYKHGVIRRDAHPKHYGLVNALFIVDDDIPMTLRYGLFSKPGREYHARIRFPNGNPIVGHDLVHDIRGCAIKLTMRADQAGHTILDDPESLDATHDFVTASGEGFFGRDAVDFVDFIKVSEHGLKVIAYFFRRFPRRLRGGLQMLSAQACPRSPFDTDFFSQTPYRLGPHCVKYHVRRLERRRVKRDPWYRWFGVRHVFGTIVSVVSYISRGTANKFPGFDVLRTSLQRDLHDEGATLEFLVQRWPDLSKLPVWAIENSTRRWDGTWVRVAKIVIPQGQPEVGTEANLKEAERMSFNPWRALPEHQPLGSVNRARRKIYEAMSAFRLKHRAAHHASHAEATRPADDEMPVSSA